MSLLFNMMSRLVITFLPRSKCLLTLWPQSPPAVILEPPKLKSVTVSPSICHEVMGPDAIILVFWMLSCFFCLFVFFFECWVLNQLFYSPLSLSSRGTLVMIAIDWMFASKVHVNHNGPIWWYLKVCLYHEGGALVNRTSALIKRGLESFLTSFTWSYKEKTGIYVPGSKLSPDIKPASTIMLDSSASRIVTNQFPWFINHQSIVFSLEPD